MDALIRFALEKVGGTNLHTEVVKIWQRRLASSTLQIFHHLHQHLQMAMLFTMLEWIIGQAYGRPRPHHAAAPWRSSPGSLAPQLRCPQGWQLPSR